MSEEQKERNRSIAKANDAARDITTAPDAGRDTMNPEAQFGRKMHSSSIIRKLKKMNGSLMFEVSKSDPTRMGVYAFNGVSNMLDPNPKYRGYAMVCGMESGESPEFSIRKAKKSKQLITDADGNVTGSDYVYEFVGEVRGWRTVLARLIRFGIIDLSAAEKEFKINQGPDSKNWKMTVH
jgi:hypothetical protein